MKWCARKHKLAFVFKISSHAHVKHVFTSMARGKKEHQALFCSCFIYSHDFHHYWDSVLSEKRSLLTNIVFVIQIWSEWNKRMFCFKNQCASSWHIINRWRQLEYRYWLKDYRGVYIFRWLKHFYYKSSVTNIWTVGLCRCYVFSSAEPSPTSSYRIG